MEVPMKPPKARQINVRVEDSDLETKEILKSRGVDIAELYRRAIRSAHAEALKAIGEKAS